MAIYSNIVKSNENKTDLSNPVLLPIMTLMHILLNGIAEGRTIQIGVKVFRFNVK
jgi:hypothetical protein